jgi:L-threonylcarbamoyladenylate synthase
MKNRLNEQILMTVVQALHRGVVIAYPTEAVFGLGCDPDNQQAVDYLLSLKQRSREKGLILVAANYSQLKPYVDASSLSEQVQQEIFLHWPGPTTWLIPAQQKTASWLTGQFTTLAVRVSDHPIVQQLCLAFGKALVSTSANLSGLPECRTLAEVRRQFGERVMLVEGALGGRMNPSEIRDATSGKLIRRG